VRFEHGHEVYVLFEGVFALDSTVDDAHSDWVTVRTSTGARIELPIEAVAEWDVETPLGPDGRLASCEARSARAARM
jgi:hypothetical protein